MTLRFLQFAYARLTLGALLGSAMLVAVGQSAWAAGAHGLVQRALADHYGASRVEILELAARHKTVAAPEDFEAATVLHSNSRGEAAILLRGLGGVHAEYQVRFAAWVLGWVAHRRILPGEPLQVDAMKVQEVNVAAGLAHESRGILLPPAEDLSRLEARQTILEGGFVTTVAVRKIPDLRRGDTVRLEVLSGEVRLSSPAIALEPGNINQRIKVQTLKGKRELVGLVRDGGIVEVKL